MIKESDLLTITELSQYLRVHPATIYRLLRHGRIPGFRVGGALAFQQDRHRKMGTHTEGLNRLRNFSACRPFA